ncbi:MAG: ATP-binding cassette domain-containing protein [Pseudomonadota bacterium]
MSSVLTATDLTQTFDAGPVLQNFSLELKKGEHTLLLGPSGSGKTTLINLICGLMTPTSGEITICGEAISTADGAMRDTIRRRHIGFVPQQTRLVSALTVEQNLHLAKKLADATTSDVNALISEVGLSHRANAKPRQLSQGEAQRAAIARALVAKPALLIADEPTAALDDANAERVARLFLEAAEANGSTLLIATHDARLKAHIEQTISLTNTGGRS